jgi:hypothetical protein
MHTLENALLMLADECLHRYHSPEWLADTLRAFAFAASSYEPPAPGEGVQDPLEHFNRQLTEACDRRRVVAEVLEFARRKRRLTWPDFLAWYVGVTTEPDEPNQEEAPNTRRLKAALAGLVRAGALRRYGRCGYEYVPHRQRSGPRPVDAEARP